MAPGSSRIPGFHRSSRDERVEAVRTFCGLDAKEGALLDAAWSAADLAHPSAAFDQMVENCIGSIGLPLGVATNFQVDGVDRLVPMAIEEPSVIAAASHAAKLARPGGGFKTEMVSDLMIAQVHLTGCPEVTEAVKHIEAEREHLIAMAEPEESGMAARGGGTKDLEVRTVTSDLGPVVVVHLLVDTLDAMGANAVNTRAERIAPELERLSGGTARLRILSNLADRRVVQARATFGAEAVGGEDVVDGIIEAQRIAEVDPYRAATHNKGVMNGIDAVVVATGNDWRAVEAGAHAFAARRGVYGPLTTYDKDDAGDLVGALLVPLTVGIVGGATKANPMARLALRILGVASASELARVTAAVGLAQNLAALRALSTEGIQKGHMRLHERFGDRI